MPIILAIEPDRRQAAHLAGVVRNLVGAELILADTTEGALDAIGNRVPDLVLVPALLSPQDDAALAAALRVIAAAANVRTLTIPLLANGTKRAAPLGLLAKWRRGRAASPEPEGCDPAVFGEQISAYLQEAAAERAELGEEPPVVERTTLSPSVIEPPVIEPPAAIPLERLAATSANPVTEETTDVWAVDPIEPLAATAAYPVTEETTDVWAVDSIEPLAAISVDPVTEETTGPGAVDPIEQPTIDLSEELAGLSDEADDDLFDGERIGIYTIPAEPEEPHFDAFDLLPAVLEASATTEQATATAPVTDTSQDEPFVESLEPLRADIEPWVPMYLTPGRIWPALEGMPAETPAARTEQPDWIELVASLRQDLERRRTDPPSPLADPIAARPSDGAESDPLRLVKKQKSRAKKSKPIQDEWGFFDPEQCGFSTLLAKLDEITAAGAGDR